MACIGVRVERTVRLGSVVEVGGATQTPRGLCDGHGATFSAWNLVIARQ
jgi:hypothetical protein